MALPEPLDPVFVGEPLPAALNEERTAINDLTGEVGARIPHPAGVDTGELLRWDGTKWVPTLTRFFEGEGNPNGVVAAPVGSRYVNTLATRSEVEWVKSSGGDTNQGWTTSAGHLSPQGQHGNLVLSGASAKTKSGSTNLDANIFQGVAPRRVLLSVNGNAASFSHPYLVSKSPTSLTIGVRHLDNTAYTTAQTISVDWFAII